MIALTPAQIAEILKTVDAFTASFILQMTGSGVLWKEDIDLLKALGIDLTGFIPEYDTAYQFGMMSSAAELQGIDTFNDMTYQTFKSLQKDGKEIKLTQKDMTALAYLKNKAYSDIKGLGNKIKLQINSLLQQVSFGYKTEIEADPDKRAQYEKMIQEKAVDAVLNKQTVKEFALELGNESEDWGRDFERIAHTTLQNAYQYGRVNEMQKLTGGKKSVMYYKEVYPGACKHCIRLYLTDGIGSEPKLFTFEELLANGTNVGRKADEWLPVVGATHPYCRCEINSVDTSVAGEWQDGKYKIPDVGVSKRELSKYGVEIEVNDKKFYV